jgi:hypothetical protein
MNISIFGYKLRVEIILLCILLVWFIHANTFFSCAGGVQPGVMVIKEGFESGKKMVKAATAVATKNAKKGATKVATQISKELQK